MESNEKKKILITGQNSYVGKSFNEWLKQWSEMYEVDMISLRNEKWENLSFSDYSSILHVAAIVHKQETKDNENLYYQINRDLTYRLALKAKKDGVKQFIFISTMSVYGVESGIINKKTEAKPKSNYGKSKLQAENLIFPLSDINFKVVILRPPMIYGENCVGNYNKLRKLALKTPVFPWIENKRSVIYINNFNEFIRLTVNNNSQGIFLPQNKEYMCTSKMVRHIANANGKKIIMLKLFNHIIRIFKSGTVNKVFGDLIYEKSEGEGEYNLYDFPTSILLTEARQLK